MSARRLRLRDARALLLLLPSLVSACTVGPDYHAAHPVLPDRFAGAKPGALPDEGMRWWTAFGDQTLDDLVRTALADAPTIAQANARVAQARALAGATGAELLPQVDADGAYTRNLGSQNVPTGVRPGGLGRGVHSNIFQAGFDASWEIDVFGGVRRQIEGAQGHYQAAIEDRRDATLTLIAEIARAYWDLRGAQETLAIARANANAQADTAHLAAVRLSAGLSPVLDPLRADAQTADVRADIPVALAAIRGDVARIAALTGHPPETLIDRLEVAGPLPQAMRDPPPGLPSDLLRRRPDIRAAERRMQEANARIGVATSDYYPHFYLTGVAGIQSLNADRFFTGGSLYYQAGPTVRWLIFDAGRTRFRIEGERARTDEAYAAYRQVVLNALRDVETAMSAYARAQDRSNMLETETRSEQHALDVAQRLYRVGATDYLTVLDAQRTLYRAQTLKAQSDRDCAVDLVAFYKALGGGWQDVPAIGEPNFARSR
ncbi:secretion system type I outer membrane efflux pump lipoprotein NodT [Neoasaia chiangmaiensis NBRC 101099]|uniref:Uncharacterized protein n=1 Tax=Neoasaia chiangmaiensis TaxID=320497 RepID=A0A1U9KLH4_9PROT|nr:efflux transporter outer membrane subunit [Neoasaia chiangmaiensis]AQS86656.1 hypothetical protein A0U93_00375 [Neoasaia chiangmaiensis]GBR41331.1 secretion system type I outer membrane efflux pump lipoprotein NodT [Neoasaia chiangmaiensis NBRC 101099]GEN16676.1 RND transporter [Neoasaia chiangmaiensis]